PASVVGHDVVPEPGSEGAVAGNRCPPGCVATRIARWGQVTRELVDGAWRPDGRSSERWSSRSAEGGRQNQWESGRQSSVTKVSREPGASSLHKRAPANESANQSHRIDEPRQCGSQIPFKPLKIQSALVRDTCQQAEWTAPGEHVRDHPGAGCSGQVMVRGGTPTPVERLLQPVESLLLPGTCRFYGR